ncbi:FAD-dependent oxidoreductase [Nonlabens ponticola]|uniref:FAD-dependent monooxygenase n=1 Tax=Nonlabens ponticola TaxID=2496866 RepID=A0A3S9MZ47_9FLAO|nr:NAD(P)/FAD-dependent oxidoreductase [Nonlabens ponticola]AZQ44437.1 FAD-dependent monooxygenase [Nonlabens ponticola]
MYWTVCPSCKGRGSTRGRIKKKAKLDYQRKLETYLQSNQLGYAPIKPRAILSTCKNCQGSGLVKSGEPTPINNDLPQVAIVGAGIGGTALAVACQHRGIPFTLFERDGSFDERSQGYGLTLQQAHKAMQGFGIEQLENGVVSTRHVVHDTAGNILGEWGLRKWLENNKPAANKNTNIHIARQTLRQSLMDMLDNPEQIKWDHQLTDLQTIENNQIQLSFQHNDTAVSFKADLAVGADGIRSKTRELILGDTIESLRYLECIVMLGICPLENIKDLNHELLDNATVFQTANGHERMYMMPYKQDQIMWQFSYPIDEEAATRLSKAGTTALKKDVLLRTKSWHDPIPQIIEATSETLITGYPVYDRDVLNDYAFAKAENSTLLGDAAHPMSPFKGQGANQALLDALSLARNIYHGCRPQSNWREKGIRKSALMQYEREMIQRSSVKVKESARAARFLHTDEVMKKMDAPRGRAASDS